MSKDNLPLALVERNRSALPLKNHIIFDCEESLFEAREGEAESALVFLPKSKALIDLTLAFASKAVVKGGAIVLAGANDAGIRSANKAFEGNVGPVSEKIVGNHSALYVGTNEKRMAEKPLEDYLAFNPISYTHGETEIALEVAHLPGVFSAGKLDPGTRLLLSNIPYGKKRVLDVGSGAGVLGSLYKKISPETAVFMSDASKLAVRSTQETIKKNGVEAVVFESDVLANIPKAQSGHPERFDLIVSNPPFHTGVSTDYAFIDKLARDAKGSLALGGELYVVANSFLPYERTLETKVGPTTVIADNGKFKVLRSVVRI